MRQYFEVCNNLDKCLHELGQNSNVAVGISRAHGLHSRTHSTSEFYCFDKPEIIYEYDLKFLMRKDFPYSTELNRFIDMTGVAGLINKWYSHGHTKVIKPENTYSQIKMENFYGGYMIWLILYISSIFLFALERFVYKKVTSSNTSNFWIIAEMIIDSDRHFLLENKWN